MTIIISLFSGQLLGVGMVWRWGEERFPFVCAKEEWLCGYVREC